MGIRLAHSQDCLGAQDSYGPPGADQQRFGIYLAADARDTQVLLDNSPEGEPVGFRQPRQAGQDIFLTDSDREPKRCWWRSERRKPTGPTRRRSERGPSQGTLPASRNPPQEAARRKSSTSPHRTMQPGTSLAWSVDTIAGSSSHRRRFPR